jgi:hypothetical protein
MMILQPATPKSGEDPRGGTPGVLPPKIGKDMIFLRKMVIFHTKYPKHFRASLRSAQFFKERPPYEFGFLRQKYTSLYT